MANKIFFEFCVETVPKHEVADVSQTHPIVSFAENWHQTCRADEALEAALPFSSFHAAHWCRAHWCQSRG
jgi:hypothetical protein